jgi:hypothetical protein
VWPLGAQWAGTTTSASLDDDFQIWEQVIGIAAHLAFPRRSLGGRGRTRLLLRRRPDRRRGVPARVPLQPTALAARSPIRHRRPGARYLEAELARLCCRVGRSWGRPITSASAVIRAQRPRRDPANHNHRSAAIRQDQHRLLD